MTSKKMQKKAENLAEMPESKTRGWKMKIFNLFKPKAKAQLNIDETMQQVEQEEDFPFPQLHLKDIEMTKELQRRMENEKLLKKYGASLKKTGEFI